MAKDQYKAHRQAEPLFRLIHGLPGSGKSKVLKWLRSYLVDVWHMTEEEDFVFLAPMNSMAAGIGGSTLHPWAEIKWMNQQGQVIQPNRSSEGRDVPSLAVKNLKLRYLFFDEVEAAGAELLTEVNNHTTTHVKMTNRYKYPTLPSGQTNYSAPLSYSATSGRYPRRVKSQL